MGKERPILFNGDMVRAILSGQKTQTRRVIKPQPEDKLLPSVLHNLYRISYPNHWVEEGASELQIRDGEARAWACPHGSIGDRLWVRETWSVDLVAAHSTGDGYDSFYVLNYRADDAEREVYVSPGEPDPYLKFCREEQGIWRPSIHMPRAASRITLEITGVRVERLQDISAEDCWAEGIESAGWDCEKYGSVVHCFEDLWRSTGGDWDANPWVWVIEFKPV